jgi:hypothetical protein
MALLARIVQPVTRDFEVRLPPQLMRFDSTSYDLPYSFRVVFLLLGLAMIMNFFHRWTNEMVKSKYDITAKKVLPTRRLRTSSVLMLLGVGSFMYWGLEASRISGYFFALSWITIWAAFVLRHWEDNFFNQ